jgi:peptidoglycan/LPS O-acetylase OafA/YrhL
MAIAVRNKLRPASAAPPVGDSAASRVEALDGIRGVAAFVIVLHHAVQLSMDDLDSPLGHFNSSIEILISIFFALSGFVIYAPFVRARMAGTRMSLPRYAVRRSMRILPLYWVTLTLLALVFTLPGVLSGEWWRHYALLQVYSPATSPFGNHELGDLPGLPPAWTLCIELTFYLLVPFWARLAAWMGARVRRPVAVEIAALVALGLVSYGLRRAVFSAQGPTWYMEHQYLLRLLPTTLLWFIPGMVLAVLVVGGKLPRWTANPSLALPAAAACFLAILLTPPLDLSYVLAAALAGAVILPAAGGRAPGWLRRPGLLWLGAVSYALYLVHYPIAHCAGVELGMDVLPTVVVTVVLSLTAAWALHHAVERPSMRLTQQLVRRPAPSPA